ncbi:MAG: hypothetical protein AAF460_01795, partial [Pseudomonadota bacterium]
DEAVPRTGTASADGSVILLAPEPGGATPTNADTAARVVRLPTDLALDYFGDDADFSVVPRVIDGYIGKVKNPSRMVGRIAEIAHDVESDEPRAPWSAGPVVATRRADDPAWLDLHVRLDTPGASVGDVMVAIRQKAGHGPAVLISPATVSDDGDLSFPVRRRHLPISGLRVRVYSMTSSMPLIVEGDVVIE